MQKETFRLEKLVPERFAAAEELFAECRAEMYGRGLYQWKNGYPGLPELEKDYAAGAGYLLTEGDEVLGYAAFIREGEPTYQVIREGRWLTDGRYAAVHRVAVRPNAHRRGLGTALLKEMFRMAEEEGFSSVRIDTHGENLPMQGLLGSLGFTHCGEITLANGEPRRAYERILSDPVIRPAREKDWELYLEMLEQFYHTDAVLHPISMDCHRRNFAECLREDGRLKCFFLEWEGRPAGIALLALNWSTEVGGLTVWIEDLFILEPFRGRGMGKAFFRRLDAEYGAAAYRYRLEVEEENEGAVRLYKNLGFDWLGYRQMVKDFPEESRR